MCSSSLRETPNDIYNIMSRRIYNFNIKEMYNVKQILSAINSYNGKDYIFFCEEDHIHSIINKICLNYRDEKYAKQIYDTREILLKMSYEENFVNLINGNIKPVVKYHDKQEKDDYINRLALITSLFKDKQ